MTFEVPFGIVFHHFVNDLQSRKVFVFHYVLMVLDNNKTLVVQSEFHYVFCMFFKTAPRDYF